MWCILVYHISYNGITINRLHSKDYAETRDVANQYISKFLADCDIFHQVNDTHCMSAVGVYKKSVFHIIATNVDVV